MSKILDKIKETFVHLTDKYFVEVALLKKSGTIPETVTKDYVVYDQVSNETDFTKDPNKATCFDSILGITIVNQLKKELAAQTDISVSLVSVSDAMFVHEIQTGLKKANEEALSPQEIEKMKVANNKLSSLKLKIERIEGVLGTTVIVAKIDNKKIPTIQIDVANIESKTRLFALNNDSTKQPLLIKSSKGETIYEGVPVKIIIQTIAQTV